MRRQRPAADARAARARGRVALFGWALVLVVVAVAGVSLLVRGLSPQAPPDAPLPAHPFDRRAESAQGASAGGGPERAPAPSYGPNRLGIPSLGVDAPLVPESVGAGGDLVIPGDPATVGLWREGPGLAATEGTTLVAGHVSVAGIGDGALLALHRIEPGALVVTTDSAGASHAWRVDALLVRDKDALPAFPTAGPRRLAIVTCGGPLLRSPAGNTYRDNIISFASPAPS